MTVDAFQTAQARRRVLAAWADSADRFREDANSEEDLVLGGYRDRLIVELAQNAADAATRAGVPGRLLLRLTAPDAAGPPRPGPGLEPDPELDPESDPDLDPDLDQADGELRATVSPGSLTGGRHGVLIAANTGAGLDLAGVRALSSLRASAKRDSDTVGRFGVGFSAVLAVTDEPAVLGRSGGVRFSAAETRSLVQDLEEQAPELGAELARRDGQVPILRLPFAADATPPEGYDTAVVLSLRDQAARELVVRLLAATGDALLLALPGLTEIVIELPGAEPVVLAEVEQRWHVVRRGGELDPAVTAGRPVEERTSTSWQVTWAVPREAGAEYGVPPAIYAPTPSDEPMTLPALLIATLPLDPSRRHVAPGPITEAVIRHAAEAYADLVADRARDGAQAWRLVPSGLPAGAIDGALRAAVAQLLPGVAMLPAADEPELLLRPRDALAMAVPIGADERAVPELATWVAGLVLAPRAADAAFTALGVRRLDLATLIEDLPQAADPERWHQLYDVLEPYAIDPREREAMASIGVPLAGGRVVRGARGLLLGTDGVPAAALARLGVKVIDPAAAHPLLERLGATAAGPRAVLELEAVRSAVLAQGDGDPSYDDELSDVTEAVLQLVQAAVGAGQLTPGDLSWLGELELDDDEDEPAPAASLALPGSPAAGWFDADDIGLVNAGLVQRWGAAVLAATGVLSGPGLWHGHDLGLDEPPEASGDDPDDLDDPANVLDGWQQWAEETLEKVAVQADPLGAVVPELMAVRDLDAVRPDALPEVVAALAADPALRRALVDPVRVQAGPATVEVLGHTAWWLRRELTGGAVAGPDAEPGLAGLLPPAPDWVVRLDPAVRRALGIVTGLDDLDATALPQLLDRLADPDVPVSAALLLRLLRRMAALAGAGGGQPEAPESVRAWSATGTVVVAAGEACVVDAPMYRQRADLGWPLPVPAHLAGALADLLDLPLARELAAGGITEHGPAAGVLQPIDPTVRELLGEGPDQWCEHEELLVDDVEVDWWVDDAGLAHAATVDGLARALASAADRWSLRDVLSAVLQAAPDEAARLVSEAFADEAFTSPRP